MVELDARLRWRTDDVFRLLVDRHAALGAARDRMWRAGRTPSMAERVALGRLVEDTLAHERQALGHRLQGWLRPVCRTLRSFGVRAPADVVRMAGLVERARWHEVERALAHAAAALDDPLVLRCSGPWPPQSFVDVHMQLAAGQEDAC